jgi:hypothetical protein
MLNAFEKKVSRKIYGPVLDNGQWQNTYNHEIYNSYTEMELTKNIRLRRLQWMGNDTRMKNEKVPKKALKGYTEGRRPVGRRRRRRIDAEDTDAKIMLKLEKVGRGHRYLEADEEAKAQVGL